MAHAQPLEPSILWRGVQALREGRLPYRISLWLRRETYIKALTEAVFRLVFVTPPIRTCREATLECVSLVGHGSVPAYLVAIKSFARFCGRQVRVTVISDGTLSRQELKQLSRHVQGVRILFPEDYRPARFTNGEDLQEVRRRSPHTRKLIDLPFEDLAEQVVVLDSDVIFRRAVDEDFFDLQGASCRYNRDHDHSVHDEMFHLAASFLEERGHRLAVSDLNAGLMLFESKALRTDLAEDFFLYLKARGAFHYVMEQDCWCVLASAAGAKALSDRYWVGCNPEHWSSAARTRAAVSKHYVGGIRYRTLKYALDVLAVWPQLQDPSSAGGAGAAR
jgi:hypothetical protein